jgi:hypothetical protein
LDAAPKVPRVSGDRKRRENGMVRIIKAAIVVLLFCVSSGFRTESKIRQAQDIVPLNVKRSLTSPLGTLRMTKFEVDAILNLLKLDQIDFANLKSLVIFPR